MKKTDLKYTILFGLLCFLLIILVISFFLGEILLIICGALHLGLDIFNISDGGAISMIVIGSLLFLGNVALSIIGNK